MNSTERVEPWAALQIGEFRYLLASLALSTIASRAILMVVGIQVYELTGDPLALGMLGLAEVIPAISLALIGGHVADRTDRRRMVLLTDAVAIVCAVLFAVISLQAKELGVWPLYAVVFLAGIARGFGDPASSAFETQVVPRTHYLSASTLMASTWQACAILGPALGGMAYAWLGVTQTYVWAAVLFAIAWMCIWAVASKPIPQATPGESMFASIAKGVRFVLSVEELIGSMALDLFAVFFGGAIAMLPAFGKDILHVGADGVGWLSAAPSVGSLLIMLWSTRFPPLKRAGRNLLGCVVGFGVAMIVFALSTNYWLSLAALAVSGAFDGVSVVIRKAILRVKTPDHMRGRVSAVGSIFIASSNELGAFESGVAAAWLGIVPSVVYGGVATLVVAALTAVYGKKLRSLSITSMPLEDEPADGAEDGAA